ncbi:MAG TPA: hypothetical protein VGF69_18765, partial [Thermoanaerobaculia bacterium]
IGHPNPAEIAAVVAAIDGAVAAAGAGAGAAAMPDTIAIASRAAAANVAGAFGWALPAVPDIWPGVANGAYYAIPSATVRAAVEANLRLANGGALGIGVAAISAAHAASVLRRPRSGNIVYSYGVHSAAFTHPYRALPGPYGHAHPSAVLEYAARGWTVRMNTSVDAWQGGQPDPFPAAIAAVGGGNCALGWETEAGNLPAAAPYHGPLRGDDPANAPGVIERSLCPLCGPIRFSSTP